MTLSDTTAPERAKPDLDYPFPEIPQPAEVLKVADGVHWVRMPLPFTLNHINLWLLEDDDGWAVVDTGVASSAVKDLWRQIFKTGLNGKPVTRLFVTHLHPDHVGLAGWFTRKWQIELEMSRTDFLQCRNLVLDTGRDAPEEAVSFYRAAGFNEAQLEQYRKRFGGFGAAVSRLPDVFRRVKEGDTFTIGGRVWQAIIGTGHAPEHVCLYCPEANILISGDQLLPRISSNISVHPTEAYEDPLNDWLTSCAKLKNLLPEDVLVLPAHNEPFYGAHLRLQDLIDEHEENLARLQEMLTEPRRAVDVFPALFKRVIDDGVFHMATGESLAHLNCLIGREQAKRTRDKAGVDWYAQA